MAELETNTSSTHSNRFGHIRLDDLLNKIKTLPEPPKIYGMNWCKIVPAKIVPPNTIFVSMDLAEWLEDTGIVFFKEAQDA